MRCFLLTCLTLSAFAVLGAVSNCSASGGARGADARTAEYWRAVSLINLGRRSRFERRDRAAWGEFARAYSILSDIRGMDPDFQKRSLALRLRACEVAIHHLEPSLPELDRRLSSTSEAVSESLSRAMTQNDEILRVIREIRDYLELLGEKEPEDAEEQEEMAGERDRADEDRDGLTDEEEARMGTSPTDSDTDGDGLTDFEEVMTYGTLPVASDSDSDDLSDSYEVASYDTDPLNADTDSDDLEDGQEKVWGTDPNNPDTDGDGDTDGEEVKAGYDPLRHYPDDYYGTGGEPPD